MNAANDARVLAWHPDYQPYFERFNKAWISANYTMEPIDHAVLEEPETHILGHGGDIIFAALGDELAGTVAYKHVDENIVEMTKMAVDEAFQGRRLGWLLATAIMERAAQAGYTRMILYSNTKQAAAINMYRKLGFQEMELESGGYERCNIKMGIDLQPPVLASLGRELRKAAEQVSEKLLRFSNEEAGVRPSPAKWSRKEVLGHLIDSATNNYPRFIRAQHSEYSELPGYNQDFWVEARQYQYADWKELVQLWKTLNLHIARILPLIPAKALGHIVVIGPGAPVTLQYIAEDYLRHLQHHLNQIFPVHANY
ncbi:GNAT family N-acetyltransferase [Chitinophaga lutea]|uniref:GNAT family N-acetyltransferase n=1 Tax=Chitinophaga lutea TaxID=2488634 RepID=A0A3N4PQF0_9BACT|nr:GNAT family N-acetyltransferase [Chitinophaga lutea]RPE08959.1 GNAT family N-acetyltransferase [Chitinophaga lutea]